jgi:hypothetical protein
MLEVRYLNVQFGTATTENNITGIPRLGEVQNEIKSFFVITLLVLPPLRRRETDKENI